jgi:maleate isomerase
MSPRDHHIGLIVPSSNLTMEAELPRMLRAREEAHPEDRFRFHSARPDAERHLTPEQLRAMNAEMERAAAELADARPDVVATAGPGYHCTLLGALDGRGATRIAILTPYLHPLTDAVVAYLGSAGIEVVDAPSLEVPDNLAVARLAPAALLEHWRTLDLSRADALVLSACVQMPSLQAVEAVDITAGIPVLSAATATVHRLLTDLRLPPVAPGAGLLLSGRVATPATP